MATKMRLQRFGKKRSPFYHIVIADGRAPRDGKFIEKIGTYNPIPNPAEIKLNFDKALDWLQKGAQPTETMRAILSYKGVLYKNHLLNGLKKGALTEAEVEAKFKSWLTDKEAKVEAKRSGLLEKERNERKAILESEAKINEDRAAELAKRKAAAIEEQVAASQEAEEETAETEETAEEEMVTKEAVAAKVAEAAEAEAKTEEKAETKEEPEAEVKTEEKAETKEEPKAEAKTEEKAETKEEPKAEEKKESEA
jgi:small subunit ribosomal protein S16